MSSSLKAKHRADWGLGDWRTGRREGWGVGEDSGDGGGNCLEVATGGRRLRGSRWNGGGRLGRGEWGMGLGTVEVPSRD